MDKKLAGLIGAVGALAAAPSHAATRAPVTAESLMEISSYSDLLRPIPNASAVLAQAAAKAVEAPAEPEVMQVQYYYHHHHHHHHHHRYYRRYHHHHHHHHHNSVIGAIAGAIARHN